MKSISSTFLKWSNIRPLSNNLIKKSCSNILYSRVNWFSTKRDENENYFGISSDEKEEFDPFAHLTMNKKENNNNKNNKNNSLNKTISSETKKVESLSDLHQNNTGLLSSDFLASLSEDSSNSSSSLISFTSVPNEIVEKLKKSVVESDTSGLNLQERTLLGVAHFEGGFNFEVNHRAACLLWLDAANEGDYNARYALAIAFLTGKGTNAGIAEPERAVQLLAQCARAAHPYGQYMLANCFYQGQGIKKDIQEALSLYKLAGSNGLGIGWYNAAMVLSSSNSNSSNSSSNSEEIETEIDELFSLGSQLGHLPSTFALGSRLLKRRPVNESVQKRGANLILSAAESGLVRAQFNAGVCYFIGKGLDQSFEKAIYWWKSATDSGFPFAAINLGNMYTEGRGNIDKDFKKAEWYYNRAINCALTDEAKEEAKARLKRLKDIIKEEEEEKKMN